MVNGLVFNGTWSFKFHNFKCFQWSRVFYRPLPKILKRANKCDFRDDLSPPAPGESVINYKKC